MSSLTTLTPEQVKQQFRAAGITFTTWAREHGYQRYEVYRVLNGVSKAHYGRAHDIAVKLRLKVQESTPGLSAAA
jgi:gp16 family phage-associated protein